LLGFIWVDGVCLGNVVVVNAHMGNIPGITAGHMAIHTSLRSPDRCAETATLVFAFLAFGLVAAHTRLIKPVLIGFLHAHMGIVAVDAREIDVGIVLVEIALV
jgi:hypothetical protein